MKIITNNQLGEYGLGNQIYQYIFLLIISKLTNREIIITKKQLNKIKIHKYFTITLKSKDEIIYDITYKENIFDYDDKLINNIKNDDSDIINVNGFFQSYHYFINHQIFLSNEFILLNQYETQLNTIYQDIIKASNNKQLVSIHVRRGDYIRYCDYHIILPPMYFLEAIQQFNENDIDNYYFVICSDDIKWCQRFFYKISDKTYFSDNSEIIDLFLMSKCDHHIISNSSYSLFSSLLSKKKHNKKYIGSKIWFGSQGPKYDINNILPNYFIKIDL